MDFDLDRMGWRQFEHLIQSLSLRELGNGVQMFGDGIDGGREATFNGPLNFPQGEAQLWDGYGVIQAKHKLFPSDDSYKNADELIADIRSELSKFVPDVLGKTKRKRKPEYYLIATNIRLSPKEDTGGLDRVVEELALWEKRLGLKGTYVWHYTNICRMLEASEEIRRAFAGFVTPGDVLSELMTYFGAATGSIGTQLQVHAAQQLRSKQWVQLGESGGAIEDRLALSEVGIDLPAFVSSPHIFADDDPVAEVGVLRHVLARGDANLRKDFEAPDGVGIVIVGGPGQGKSTLGQLICQAYRAALLSNTADVMLGSNVKSVLDATREHLTELGIPLPANRRWPVHVELSKYGDALTSDPTTSLLKFIASGIVVKGETLKANQLDRWKSDWPWLLVLDGLDEVAAMETRGQVIEQIANFVTECRFHDQDVLIVATTRPQGYHGEFAEFQPEQLELRSLTATEGLDYGKRLVGIRHADDPDARPGVLERLTEASGSDVTSRLMRSPLQVTIMTMLLESAARVPSTKHALFDAYYNTIYSREVGRAGTLGALLERHREHIDFVHEQVGLRLQISAELAGESEAMLSDAELEELFQAQLTADGYDAQDVARLSTDLIRAAKNRVVLLVGKRADHVAFEVRSLQEYMAARALSTGKDEQILGRIEALASSSYWRHTLLLLIGRAFAKTHLRDAIVGRLRQLDTTTEMGMFLGYGEMLAVDLLDDDLAFTVPRIRRALLEHALGALRRWPRPELRKLADVAKPYADASESSDAMLVKRLVKEAFESSGRARISAVGLLRAWQGKPGGAGAFANMLLEGDSEWRPDVESGNESKYSIRTLIEGIVSLEGLTTAEAASGEAALSALERHSAARDLSVSEVSSFARQRISLTDALELQVLLEHAALADRLIEAIDKLPMSDAVAASWLQQLVAMLDERRSVGTDERIVAVSRGTK